MAAANIDDVIAMAPTDIAIVSYGGVESLFVQMSLWIDGMFRPPQAIFPPALDDNRNPGQRPVTDWLGTHVQARALVALEGLLAGQSGVVGTSACIDAVVRVASAVRIANILGFILPIQENAVVSLYNAVWT